MIISRLQIIKKILKFCSQFQSVARHVSKLTTTGLVNIPKFPEPVKIVNRNAEMLVYAGSGDGFPRIKGKFYYGKKNNNTFTICAS
jgi:hypothetical protein